MLAAQERGELDPQGMGVAFSGNAGLANAHAAAAMSMPATVFVPETAPAVKVALLRAYYGADVRRIGQHYAGAYDAAMVYSSANGRFSGGRLQPQWVAAALGWLVAAVRRPRRNRPARSDRPDLP